MSVIPLEDLNWTFFYPVRWDREVDKDLPGMGYRGTISIELVVLVVNEAQ